MDKLPSEIVEIIYRKKFNLELKEHLKKIKETKYWGNNDEPKLPKRDLRIGDKAVYKTGRRNVGNIWGKVVKITDKCVYIDYGRVRRCPKDKVEFEYHLARKTSEIGFEWECWNRLRLDTSYWE